MFREQTMQRMKKYETVGDLAERGRAKNHLATMADEHLDHITQMQSAGANNLDEFRSKKARYGW